MNCKFCNKEFVGVSKKQKYCCQTCGNKAKYIRYTKDWCVRQYKQRICVECKIEFTAKSRKVKLCSRKCMSSLASKTNRKFLDIPSCLEDASRKLDKNIGYVRVYVPMHPKANWWGYYYEHRVIAEQMIGRQLFDNEIVHHKNGKRWDNRIENLEVMTREDHGKLHGQRKEDLNI